MLSTAPPFDTCLGVDLGGSKLLFRYGERWESHSTGPGFDAAELTQLLRRFIQSQHIPPAAVGIAVPGLVTNEHLVAICDVLPRLGGWNAREAIGDLAPVLRVTNDAQAALKAATLDLQPQASAITVMAGTAIGCAIQAEGRPLLGALGWAGELGYWPVSVEGVTRRLDEVAGGRFMAQRLGLDGQGLAQRAADGDPDAIAVVQQGGRALGSVMAGLINLFNPHRLSLGGGAFRLAGYLDAALDAIRAQSLPEFLAACELVTVHEIEDWVARGAAYCALDPRDG